MKIVCLSDTHSQHRNFEDKLPTNADMIIHAGDLTRNGSIVGVQDFINWFASLPYKYKIFIAGNHDFALEEDRKWLKFPDNVIYLENNSVTIEGIKIWGSPVIGSFGFAFDKTDIEREDVYYKIPLDCDIIISHAPPYKILDKVSMINRHVGCKMLKKRIGKIKPKLVIFGHAHECSGTLVEDGITYINSACKIYEFEYI